MLKTGLYIILASLTMGIMLLGSNPVALTFVGAAAGWLLLSPLPSAKKLGYNVFHIGRDSGWDCPINSGGLDHHRVLVRIAKAEHELGWLPHNDSYVTDVCTVCKPELLRKDNVGIGYISATSGAQNPYESLFPSTDQAAKNLHMAVKANFITANEAREYNTRFIARGYTKDEPKPVVDWSRPAILPSDVEFYQTKQEAQLEHLRKTSQEDRARGVAQPEFGRVMHEGKLIWAKQACKDHVFTYASPKCIRCGWSDEPEPLLFEPPTFDKGWI